VSRFLHSLNSFFSRFTTARGSSALFSCPNSYMAVFDPALFSLPLHFLLHVLPGLPTIDRMLPLQT